VGHAGTLDPMASGLLLLLFGEAKKLSNYLTAEDKTYHARVSFGEGTDSLDAMGATVERVTLGSNWCSASQLEAALQRERERTLQLPPTLSAIKIAGRPAHRRWRAGEQPRLEARPVRLSNLAVLQMDGTEGTFELSCSKGYYVRAFARDLGLSLGVPAHLSALRRTRSGSWSLNDASAWPASSPTALIETRQAALRCLGASYLTEAGSLRCQQGKALANADFIVAPAQTDTGVRVWLDAQEQLLALGQRVSGDSLRVVRGFSSQPRQP
jgi:tRNA pseudouridine55 synthase